MNILIAAFVGLVPLTAAETRITERPGIRASLARMDFTAAPMPATQIRQVPAKPAKAKRSTARKVIGGTVGVVGGFFAGGFLGAAIAGECSCDDPGLMGFIYGAPIGAILGGILGAKYF